MNIYADNAATTRMSDNAINAMLPYMKEVYGNPSSVYLIGQKAKSDVNKAKELFPDAKVLTHPECRQEICDISDFVGSTSEIIDYATKSEHKEFIVCTEIGVFYELQKKNPEKEFHQVKISQICPNMKKVTLEKVKNAMLEQKQEVILSDELMKLSNLPLEKMLEIAK